MAGDSKLSLIRGMMSGVLKASEETSLIDLFLRGAKEYPDRGISIFDRRGASAETKYYSQIVEDFKKAAAKLQAFGIKPKDTVLLCLPTSWELLDLWLGCVYLGAYPAAIAPSMGGGLGPSSNFSERLERFRDVIDASLLIGSDALVKSIVEKGIVSLKDISLSPAQLEMIETEGITEKYPAKGDELAFLQFTSGSTGIPRAVMILHRTLVHNIHAINNGLGLSYGRKASEFAEAFVSWLPLNHDMGLISTLFAAWFGLDVLLMNPATFLARPIAWLKAMSGRRCLTAAPNFGYQFCVERIKEAQLEGIDLSGPLRMCAGSEMIRPESMRAFREKMSNVGIDDAFLTPSYGMAEATLALAFDQKKEGIRVAAPDMSGQEEVGEPVVCVGAPVIDTTLRVCDAENNVLSEGQLGFIQVKGPGIFAGYYRNEEATAESLVDGWLKTGDLGFIKDGELYIAGRSKDVLIIRGENIMPHDIEWQAEEVRGRGGAERCAAFSIVRGNEGEEPVIVMETTLTNEAELKTLENKIRSQIGRRMSLVLADFVFVRRGRIPKTTSGKIIRGQLKDDYLQGRLERLN